mmetsp:Transcript_43882/g.116041  ORF Transcript_43882/g.116041 Transcript_43882/m.116041 type:complete len:134 (+) Transcript_43882:80-481(+)
MVRPVVYSPTTAFTFSEADKKRYLEIAAEVKAKGKDTDAKAAAAKIEASMAACAKDNVEPSYTDEDPSKDKDFVGFTLGGYGGSGAMSVGELEVDTEVELEEPKVIDEAEEEIIGEERSVWGDGDDEPGAAEE